MPGWRRRKRKSWRSKQAARGVFSPKTFFADVAQAVPVADPQQAARGIFLTGFSRRHSPKSFLRIFRGKNFEAGPLSGPFLAATQAITAAIVGFSAIFSLFCGGGLGKLFCGFRPQTDGLTNISYRTVVLMSPVSWICTTRSVSVYTRSITKLGRAAQRKKENRQPKGGMGGRQAATTQGF